MGDHSAIEWTNASWNPIAGCTRVTSGCNSCYAARLAATRMKHTKQYEGLAVVTPSGRAAFNGTIRLLPERLDQPLRWRRPRRIFVNSMSDLFHAGVPDAFIDKVFAVMALAPHHSFQVLTKRPERMLEYFVRRRERILWDTPDSATTRWHIWSASGEYGALPWSWDRDGRVCGEWPLRNVWLGVSVEDQRAAAERIPLLLQTPAAVRWISAEPLLGPINLRRLFATHEGDDYDTLDALTGDRCALVTSRDDIDDRTHWPGLDWVVAGGESGPGARPMDPAWARSIRDQCVAAGTAFLFKQWGGRTAKVGGRELDGGTWDEYPSNGGAACGA